jgi:hypothetical protein
MKLALVLSLAVSVGTILLSSAAALGQTATEDSVRGAATLPTALRLEFDARSGPSGENAHGTVVASFGRGSSVFSVVCLQVTGRTAVVGANLDTGTAGALFQVVDGSPDAIAAVPSYDAPIQEQDCRTPSVGYPPQPIISGDVIVTDAHPFPSSKDQCKNGGWQSFGVFKNQGECVSFVATGGENPPGSSP